MLLAHPHVNGSTTEWDQIILAAALLVLLAGLTLAIRRR